MKGKHNGMTQSYCVNASPLQKLAHDLCHILHFLFKFSLADTIFVTENSETKLVLNGKANRQQDTHMYGIILTRVCTTIVAVTSSG